MKNSIKKIAAFLCLSAMFLSCTDFLDVAPPDSFEPEEVFGNSKALDAYVTQRYAEVKHGFNRQAFRFACDEGWNNFNWDGTNGIQRGQMTADFDGNLGTWRDYYKGIKNCNIFFENIALVEQLRTDGESSRLIDQLIGEMTYLRAYFYADLISRYGGVPIITKVFKLDTPAEEMFLARNTYTECVDFVTKEIDKASKLLPITYSSKDFGRATKGAALALKSRVLLYAASPYWNPTNNIEKWRAAKNAAYAVINLNRYGSVSNNGTKVYQLDPDYKGLFLNPQSPEIIFQRLFSTEFGHYFDWYNAPNGYHGYSETCVSESLVDAYEMQDGTMPDVNAIYGGDKGKEYEIGTSPWDNREPRFYASIACDGQQYRGRAIEYYVNTNGKGGGKDSNKGGVEEWNASATGFYVRKFMNESLRESWNDKSNAPWIISRLGEIYLNYAEALYQMGNEDSARICLELIRERARGGNPNVLPKITATGSALWAKIQQERRIELVFEEHRYFDVRRWKIAPITDNAPLKGVIIKKADNGKKTYLLNTVEKNRKFYDKLYLFPIPRNEMERNSKFVQNPGGY